MAISRSTILHLRIPFSVYLMPVFCFAALNPAYGIPDPWRLAAAFIIIHIFLYPASNGYNSYFDKDTKSIGGLEHPPEVRKQLYYVSLAFDAFAVLAGYILSPLFSVMLLIYGLVSKAYSHPITRLKKYGVSALLTAAVFQGGFTYLMTLAGVFGMAAERMFRDDVIFPCQLATLMIMAFYPMTQVYQHEEDADRGDRTISLMLGIRGTFIFSGLVFLVADAGFYFYYGINTWLIFQLFLLPVLVWFGWWFYIVLQNKSNASFRNTMRLNRIASVCLAGWFVWLRIALFSF